jgi:DNA-directed RNA polymerase specialized sigma24 family protein
MSNLYFDKEVDDAIVIFCKSEDAKERSTIFEKSIYPAFKKLSQYHYNKFPIIKNPEAVHECIVFLFEQLHKFNPEKQSRGFPYFNIIAKHHFIQRMKQEGRVKNHRDSSLVSLSDTTGAESLSCDSVETEIETDQFFEILKKQLPLWRDKFVKAQEKQIVDCLITLFSEPEEVAIFKKKALLLYMKEMTGMNTKQITINLNKVKKKFLRLRAKYQRGEI